MAPARLALTIPAPLRDAAVDFVREALKSKLSAEEIAAALLIMRLDDTRTPAEIDAEETAALLAKFDAMGGRRGDAGRVARSLSRCPSEQYRISQRILAANRRRKKNAAAAFADRGPG